MKYRQHSVAVTARTIRHAIPSSSAGSRLGDRLRQLRVASGLTQSELAGDRFSKEYISQIERGKTRPTPETVAWLAARLGVDSAFLASGVSADDRARAEATLARADALSVERDYDAAVEEYGKAATAVLATGAVELRVRLMLGEAWARAHRGEVRPAIEQLEEARQYLEGPEFADVDRAELLYRLGVCRYLLSSIATAVALFSEALKLVERSSFPSDLLRANIFSWRSRCYRRQRDYEAAREDVERALELAESQHDNRALGEAYFQASLIAERDGHWVLARSYAERAKAQYEALMDRVNVGRLAQVHLRTGDAATAEAQARHALQLIGERDDMIDEIGNARLVLGRALLDQNRFDAAEAAFAAAEDAFDRLSSASHRAAAWIAQGDLADRRGDDRRAAVLYRRAAEALQDFRF